MVASLGPLIPALFHRKREKRLGFGAIARYILHSCIERGSLVASPIHALRTVNGTGQSTGKRARTIAYKRLGLVIVAATAAATAMSLAWIVFYLVR